MSPSFFANPKDLVHLLFLLPPQINDPEAKNAMMDVLGEDDVMEILCPDQITHRKKRAKKLKEPLPDEFLRGNKRQANKFGGYKGKSAVEVLSPKPLAIILASPPPASHLNKNMWKALPLGS
jgi:hypothetical protein